ncbi:tetratricopeptide repeat protein [Arthrobacter humicola]|uniref:Tetratrico peptide repeat group 5 domain-containing protein n=1 Tax=Arthrobacter humicola TaxID=409291 RepID=A0ABN2YLZ1_9MICC
MLDQQTLDRLWNFDDPALSEARFREALAGPGYDADERAELTTQLGRAIGLQGRFEEADALLDAVDGDEPTVAVRVLLERGRVLNTSGHPEMAVPLFEQAAELADHLGEEFLAVDALHMLALADSAHAVTWTRSALEYASTVHDERTKRWIVSLHNNLGWTLHDAGRCTEAMVEFQLAEQWAGRIGTPRQQELAREAIKAC